MRLIDADNVLSEIDRMQSKHHNDAHFMLVAQMIDSAPTVEPQIIHKPTVGEFKRMAAQLGYEKVVWCKDCRYCEDLGMSGLWCNNPDNRNPLGCLPDDFCNLGERCERND